MTDIELLRLAAKACALPVIGGEVTDLLIASDGCRTGYRWNPLTDDGDRYRLARQLGISIDFHDCCAWKRFPNGNLIQEFWGGDCPDEAHTIVLVAAEIGKAMK